MKANHYSMDMASRLLAQVILCLVAGALVFMVALVLSAPLGRAASPSPTPYTSCMASIPPGVPNPPSPICRTVTPTPQPSASTSTSPSPSPSPSKKPPKKTGPATSTITLVYRTRTAEFVGAVDSRGKCEDLRRVVVYKVQTGKDAVVGRDITDEKARYSVSKKQAAGRYYVTAPRSVSIGYATQVDCELIKSEEIKVAKPKPAG